MTDLPPTPMVLTPVVLGVAPEQVATPTGTAPLLADRLYSWEHVAASGSYTATETEAAGPMQCHIQRGSPAFGRLTSLTDTDIVFNQWEDEVRNQDNRLMHLAMVAPLLRLKELAAAEWGADVKLLVTAMYDSTLEDHDVNQPDLSRRYSLHFEGRSLDVVPLPAQPAYIERLCWLAHEAGFDWVHNEVDHCHASVRTESLCVYGGSAP